MKLLNQLLSTLLFIVAGVAAILYVRVDLGLSQAEVTSRAAGLIQVMFWVLGLLVMPIILTFIVRVWQARQAP